MKSLIGVYGWHLVFVAIKKPLMSILEAFVLEKLGGYIVAILANRYPHNPS
jgi:hypothetical protein